MAHRDVAIDGLLTSGDLSIAEGSWWYLMCFQAALNLAICIPEKKKHCTVLKIAQGATRTVTNGNKI